MMKRKKKPAKKKAEYGEQTLKALSAAGKKGMESRWGKDHEPTKTVRCYVSDAPRLAEVAPKAPDAIRQLLDGMEG